jgi:hypothetical protein
VSALGRGPVVVFFAIGAYRTILYLDIPEFDSWDKDGRQFLGRGIRPRPLMMHYPSRVG